MRRAVQIVVAGGALLLAAACGTSKSPSAPSTAAQPAAGASAAGPGAGALPAAASETRALCESLGQVYNKNMGAFAESLNKMVAAKGTKTTTQEAQVALRGFSVAVRGATEKSSDAQLKSDGKQAAETLQTKSADPKFFSAIKTSADVNTVLGANLKEWLAPVQHHCS
jgi:hypothetical protein